MPLYHLRNLPSCYTERCSKRATVELRNHNNEVIGYYCASDGKRRLRELLAAGIRARGAW